MRETDFIGKNKEKWRDFEQTLQKKEADPDQLSKLFIETTDDLSYSRTYYPNRSVKVYLNGLSQRVYQKVYSNRQRQKGAFSRFWTAEIPDALFYARRPMLIAFLVFIFGTSIGILSTIYNPNFTEIILSESYVEMTEGFIEEGNPMAVYAQEAPLTMFLRIALNNITVAFYAFIAGLFFEIGSIFIVFSNAVMFGSFIWFFADKNLGGEAFLAVMLHGTIELSMIIVAGAAGLVLGGGLVRPRSFTRSQALIRSARHSMKIMVAVVVFLIMAAFIEGFMTRFSLAGSEAGQVLLDLARGILILLSAGIVLLYFVYYPWLRKQNGKTVPISQQEALIEDEKPRVERQVLKVGEISNLTWKFFVNQLSNQALRMSAISGGLILLLYFIYKDDFILLFDSGTLMSGDLFTILADSFWFFDDINNFFDFKNELLLFPLVCIALSLVLMNATSNAAKQQGRSISPPNLFFNGLAASLLLCLPMFGFSNEESMIWLNVFLCLFLIIWWPMVLSCLSFASMRNKIMFAFISQYFHLLKGVRARSFGLFLNISTVAWLGITIAGAPLFYLIFMILGSQVGPEITWAEDLMFLLYGFILTSVCAVFLQSLITAFSLFYFTAAEINSAEGLLTQIAQVQFKRRAYGLEKEQ